MFSWSYDLSLLVLSFAPSHLILLSTPLMYLFSLDLSSCLWLNSPLHLQENPSPQTNQGAAVSSFSFTLTTNAPDITLILYFCHLLLPLKGENN